MSGLYEKFWNNNSMICCSPIQGTRSKTDGKQWDKSVPYFNKNPDFVPWIGGQLDIEMLIRYFSNNPDICCHVGKLLKLPFKVRLFSNPGDKIVFVIEI